MVLWRTVLLLVNVAVALTAAEILIDSDGGYKNVFVGLPPELDVANVGYFLNQLETLFQDASTSLLNASKGNVFFKEIVFVIPKKYKDWISRRFSTCAMCFKSPDIFLTVNDVFLNPYTIQIRGCGNPGLRIHIPKEFLETSETENKGIQIVKQWAHYRFGVFDESGFPNDELYPVCYQVPGTDTNQISDCTNDDAVYNFKEKNRYYLRDESDTCEPVPTEGVNDHIVSSIMSNFNYPKMKYFCDNSDHPHNRNSPTKQNALCKEQSAWEVISKHPDLKSKRKDSSNVKPTFRYILESDPRLIVAVDSSKDMEQNDRMDLVRNAFAHFLFYTLPSNSTIGLMNMKDKTANPDMFSIQTPEDAERMLNLFPDAYGESDTCVYCTVQRILEVLKLDVSDIVVITATDIAGAWTDNTITMLKSRKVALHAIYFQQNQTQLAYLEGVAKSSGGTFHYIAERFPTGSFTSSLTLLYEAFRSIYESLSWMNRNHVLIDQKTFTDDCSPNCILSFPSDRTIQTLQVMITGPNFAGSPPVLKDTIQLTNGEDALGPGNKSFAYKTQIPAFLFTIENPEPRLWDLTFQRRPGNNRPIVVMVRGMNENHKDILHMDSWISFNDERTADPASNIPITMYSRINKGNHPVFGVEVQAYIHQMSYNEQTVLKLKDNGDGGIDITKHDGISTRYLSDIKKEGYYSITIVAERRSSQYLYRTENAKSKELYCCGSTIPPSLAYNSGPFKRTVTQQSFFVKKKYVNQNYPPGRIADLRVEKVEYLKYNIKCYAMKWTAPGEDGDQGTAYDYNIRVFSTRDDALSNFESSAVLAIKMLNIQGPILVPKEAGTLQEACIEIRNLTSGIYFIAMKTVSHSNKVSDVSNIVQIVYTDATSFTGSSSIYFTTIPGDGNTEPTKDDSAVPLSSTTGLAIGLSCGFLFLLIVIGIIIFIYCERKREAKKSDNKAPGYSSKKTESNDALCNGGGSLSIISPVNSWGADSLVSHYATISKNKNEMEKCDVVPFKPNRETDSASFTSSKYSYDNKIDQYSMNDPIYYNHVQDELNYPYNTIYAPFNPIHSSPLTRCNDCDNLGIPDPSENASFYNFNPNISFPSRLKTDV